METRRIAVKRVKDNRLVCYLHAVVDDTTHAFLLTGGQYEKLHRRYSDLTKNLKEPPTGMADCDVYGIDKYNKRFGVGLIPQQRETK